MSMASSAHPASRGFPHHIGQIEFAVDVAHDLPQIGTPDRLALAIRQELLATVDQALDDAGVDMIAVTIGDIALELGHFDAPIDWDAVRAVLYAQLQSAISPYLPQVTPETPVIQRHDSPQFSHLTVVTLKALARARGLSVSGRKAELADRITQYQAGQWQVSPAALVDIKTAGDVRRMLTGTDTHDTKILRAALRGWADDDIKIAIQKIGNIDFSRDIGAGPYSERLLECLTHDATTPVPKTDPAPNVAAPQKYEPALPDAKMARAICHDHPDVAPIFSLFVPDDHLSAYISTLLPHKTGPLADAIAQLAQHSPAQRAVLTALYTGQPIDIAAARAATTLPLHQSQAALAERFMQMGDDPYTAAHATLTLNQTPAAAPPPVFRRSRSLKSSVETPAGLQDGKSVPRAISKSRDPDVFGPDLHGPTKTDGATVLQGAKARIDEPAADFKSRGPVPQAAVYPGSHDDTPIAATHTLAALSAQPKTPSSDISPDAPTIENARTAPSPVRPSRQSATLSPADQEVRDKIVRQSVKSEPKHRVGSVADAPATVLPKTLQGNEQYPQAVPRSPTQTDGYVETAPLTSSHDQRIAAQTADGNTPVGDVKPAIKDLSDAPNDDGRSRTFAARPVMTNDIFLSPNPHDVSDTPVIDGDRADALAETDELATPQLNSGSIGNDDRENSIAPVTQDPTSAVANLAKGSDQDIDEGPHGTSQPPKAFKRADHRSDAPDHDGFFARSAANLESSAVKSRNRDPGSRVSISNYMPDPPRRAADFAATPQMPVQGPDHANDTTTDDLPRKTPAASATVTASLPASADTFPPNLSQVTTTAATAQSSIASQNAIASKVSRSGQLSSETTAQLQSDADASQVTKGKVTSHSQHRPIAHHASPGVSNSSPAPSAHDALSGETKLTPRLNLVSPESDGRAGSPAIIATPAERLRALFDQAFGDESDASFAQIRLIFSALAPAVGGASADSAVFWAALMAAVHTNKPTHDLPQAVHDFATALIPDARKRGIAIRGAIARLGYPAVASAQMRQDAQQLLARMMQPADGTPAALQAKPSTVANANRLQTIHAGLVLFHPYIKMLFERLEIARDKNGILEDDLPLAAAALHRLALGDAAPVQPTDPLHKCLMGLAQDAPSVAPAPLPDAQAALIDGLVQSVIAQWGRLGSTSADGLRAAFVLRGGILDLSDPQNAHLTVNKGPFDMLLDGLPWALTMVALPWMPAPLMIDWRGSND